MTQPEQHTRNSQGDSRTALRWSAIDSIGRQGVGFVVIIVLARLISPADFGLIGMLSIFLALASSIVDSGFGSALIQRDVITEADKSSVFYFNAGMGVAGGAVLFLAAASIAQFYRQPLLLPMMRWMAVNLVIESLGVVQLALLSRELDFRSQFKAGFLALLVSGVVAVSMAAAGFGVWSLVAQGVVSTAVFTATIWTVCSWRPRARFSGASLRRLARFGSPLLISGILNVVFDRLHLAVIGKVFSATQLGYYTRAYSTQQFPSGLLSTIVARVMFPVFSQRAKNIAALQRGVRRALIHLMFLTLPVMFGLAVVARPLVMVLFGIRWLPCVPYLQLLSVAGVCWPLHVVNLNVIMAVGRTDFFLRVEIVKKVLIGLGILCTFSISVSAMVWATVIVSMLATVVNSHYSESLIRYGFRKQLGDLMPYVGAASVMACIGWAVVRYVPVSAVGQLLIAIVACAGSYALCCRALGLEGFSTLKDVLIRTRRLSTSPTVLPCTDLNE